MGSAARQDVLEGTSPACRAHAWDILEPSSLSIKWGCAARTLSWLTLSKDHSLFSPLPCPSFLAMQPCLWVPWQRSAGPEPPWQEQRLFSPGFAPPGGQRPRAFVELRQLLLLF